ncbi:3'-5' exonuclease [Bacillus taeanensis]|uniref:Exonuclease n=1 Tax=Bacillus taeanensis TaxID=273032 RepID=A0A366Y185_9BACI|nr:3'-5' exonuclease [Bacillus taeanensis]RBW71135.1 exonuclease [Bacillus taeanensis]
MADIKQYVFFDFEMLCSDRGMAYADMEAIRLGAVKYNIETEEMESFDRFIRPKNTAPLSEFCINLTGIQDCDLAGAKSFQDVFEEFLKWIGGIKRTQYFSWSPNDLSRLQLDALIHNIPPTTIKKIEKRYIDFQAIFSKRVSKNNMSVENALSLYDLQFEGEAHHPMYDAYNTLRVYLAFCNNPIKSDLIMLEKFIFADKKIDHIGQMNRHLKKQFRKDLSELITASNIIIKMKDAKKLVKRTYRMVEKYENILINRSGLFDKEIQHYVRLLSEFYQDLVQSYEEHLSYTSTIMILHEHMVQPLRRLSS